MKLRSIIIPFLVFTGCYENVDNLTKDATSFCIDLGYKVKGVSCANKDTDSDGYVSCTVNLIDNPEPIAIECRSRWKLGSGCRMQKLSLRRR